MKKISIILLAAALIAVMYTGAYALDKDNVIALYESGARIEVIKNHIKIQCCPPLEVSEIEEIAETGVSPEIVNFIIEYQENMPEFCEHSDNYARLQELKEKLSFPDDAIYGE